MAGRHDDLVRVRPNSSEPSFSEVKDPLFKFAIVLGVLVFLYIIVLGAGTLPWILVRWGWTNP